MYASVIPRKKMPAGKTAFTYQVPDKMVIDIGNIVRMPFRGDLIWGVVQSLSEKTPPHPTKKITSTLPINLRPDFIEWFASYYHLSFGTALHTMTPNFTQTIPAHQIEQAQASIHIQKTRVNTVKDLVSNPPDVIRMDDRNETLALYRGLAKTHKQVLILCPDDHATTCVAAALGDLHPGIYMSTLANGAATACFAQEHNVWIGTKRAAFLPFKQLDLIIIDQEEHESHKQFDQNPRYDIRTVAKKLRDLYKAKCISVSSTPRIETVHNQSFKDVTVGKTNSTVIPLEGNVGGLFSPTLISALESHSPTLVVFNRKGAAKFHVCTACKFTFRAQELVCPNCKGTDCFQAGIGTDELLKRLQGRFPQKTIALFDADHPNEPHADIVLSTRYAEHATFSRYQHVVLLLADQFFHAPSYTAHERAFAFFSLLSRKASNLLVQTYQPDHPVLVAALASDYDTFFSYELAQRKLLSYPPFGTVIKIIDKKTGKETFFKGNIEDLTLTPHQIIDINPE